MKEKLHIKANVFFTNFQIENLRIAILTILMLLTGATSNALSTNKDTAKQSENQENCLTLPSETKNNSKTEQSSTKGQIFLHISLPYVNNFHLNPVNEGSKNNTGFMGYSVGLDYYHKSDQYVNFYFSSIQDFFLPIAFVDRGNEYELMSSDYISISNNHKVNRFSWGYGLSFAKNTWDLKNHNWNENSSTRKPEKNSNNTLGLIFSSNFQITKHFYTGLIYKPTFWRLNIEPALKYEHTVSLDFVWKIPLKK